MQLTPDQKTALMIVGAVVVGGIVIGTLLKNTIAAVGPGVVTDQQGTQEDTPGGAGVLYTNYNTPPLNPQPLLPPSDTSAAPAGAGCCCTNSNPCAAASGLVTGDTYSDFAALLNYYQNTNPYYVQLVQAQTQQYSALFINGSTYSAAAPLQGITGP